MPNIKSSKKDVIRSKVAYEKNKADKSELKTNLKKFDAALVAGDKTVAEAAYKTAVKSYFFGRFLGYVNMLHSKKVWNLSKKGILSYVNYFA